MSTLEARFRETRKYRRIRSSLAGLMFHYLLACHGFYLNRIRRR